MTSLSSDVLYVPKQHNTVTAFWAFCDIKKKSHLPPEIPTIRYSGKLSRNKGFPGGISQMEHLRKDPPRNRGTAWQHKHEADPALKSGMKDSMKMGGGGAGCYRSQRQQQQSTGRCPEAILAVGAAKDLCFLLRWPLAGAGFSALAGQALRVYLAAALLHGQRQGHIPVVSQDWIMELKMFQTFAVFAAFLIHTALTFPIQVRAVPCSRALCSN